MPSSSLDVIGDGGDFVHLDYAASAPCVRAAVDAVTDLLPRYGSVHRGTGVRSQTSTLAYELARDVGFGSIQGPLLFHEAVAEAHLGRLDRARAGIEEAYVISRGTHEELYAVYYESLLGFVDL